MWNLKLPALCAWRLPEGMCARGKSSLILTSGPLRSRRRSRLSRRLAMVRRRWCAVEKANLGRVRSRCWCTIVAVTVDDCGLSRKLKDEFEALFHSKSKAACAEGGSRFLATSLCQ
jgi:hypothetical protein